MGILANGRNSHGARPVVVEMGLLVGVQLKLIRVQTGLVPKNVVAGRRDGSLAHALGNQEEVVSEK